jgi:AcrR family transcriptional regulator
MDTKTNILNSGKKLFSQNSFSEVTTRDIAEEAGCALSAVHYHFKTKDEILFVLVNQFATKQTELSLAALSLPESSNDLTNKLMIFADILIISLLQDLPLFQIVSFEMDRKNPVLLPIKKETIQVWFEKLINYLEYAKKKNFITKDCDCELLATIIIRELTMTVRNDDWNSHHFKKSLRKESTRLNFIKGLFKIFLHGALSETRHE